MNEEHEPSQGYWSGGGSDASQPAPADPLSSASPAVSQPPNTWGAPQESGQEYIPTGPLYPALEAKLNNPSGPASPSYPNYPAYPGSPSMPLGPYAGQMPFSQPPTGQESLYPGSPSTPLTPGHPGYAGMPGAPGEGQGQPPYAGPPSMPLGPYPGYPAYPGSPSMPLTAGTQPSQPLYPSYPGYPAYPGYPGSPSMPLSPQTIPGFGPASAALARPKEPNFLQKPFSGLLVLMVALGVVAILALTYLVRELLGADWADGARTAGFLALGLAVLALAGLIVRLVLGRRALTTILLGGVLVCVLLGAGGAGIGLTPEIHHVQGTALENGQQWGQAIQEYKLSGESAPNAPDIARTYDEWGEQFLARGNYGQAINQFMIVVNTYNHDSSTLNRANADLFKAYSAWIKTNDPAVPYSDALQFLTSYQSNPQCDSTCQSQVTEVTAQACYQWGTLLYNQGNYQQAVDELEQAQTYAQSSYAALAHTEAAKAYLSLGQQQITSDCQSALPTYQTLAQRYGDTPEGKTAKAALSAPQNVTGQISGFPAGAAVVMYLSKHADPNNFYFSGEYQTVPTANSTFTFHNVALGNYNIAALAVTSTEIYETWYYNVDTGNLYTVNVGPLCATDFGVFQFKS